MIRSLTKCLSVAGLRVGYAITNAERLSKWSEIRDPWPVNTLAIHLINMILNNKKIYKKRLNKIHKWVKEEGLWLHKNLSYFSSLSPLPSSTNFQLIKSKYPTFNVLQDLKKRGILLRDCRSFINLGEDWFRISLQKREDNIQIINTLKEYIS